MYFKYEQRNLAAVDFAFCSLSKNNELNFDPINMDDSLQRATEKPTISTLLPSAIDSQIHLVSVSDINTISTKSLIFSNLRELSPQESFK